jgi:hypothetical protein
MMTKRHGTTSSPSVGLSTLWKGYLDLWKTTTKPWNLTFEEITNDLTPTLAEALIWKAMGGPMGRSGRPGMWIKPRYPLTNQKNLYTLRRKESESAS